MTITIMLLGWEKWQINYEGEDESSEEDDVERIVGGTGISLCYHDFDGNDNDNDNNGDERNT